MTDEARLSAQGRVWALAAGFSGRALSRPFCSTRFDPATTQRHFRIATSDYVLCVLLQPVIERVTRLALGGGGSGRRRRHGLCWTLAQNKRASAP